MEEVPTLKKEIEVICHVCSKRGIVNMIMFGFDDGLDEVDEVNYQCECGLAIKYHWKGPNTYTEHYYRRVIIGHHIGEVVGENVQPYKEKGGK